MVIWDIIQQQQIGKARSRASDAGRVAGQAESRVADLERRMDRLVLACAAMLEFLEEKTGVTDTDIRDRMREIDMRDGTKDGKITRKPVPCRKCKRDNNPRRGNCR